MADRTRAVSANVPGSFFVDATCIDCDACRQLAPTAFGDGLSTSFVQEQPRTDEERYLASLARIACPVGAIGSEQTPSKAALNAFPLHVDGDAYYCGYNAESSFGANSYLVVHPEGNWMIDSPRFTGALVRKIEALGGLRYIFLTHRDDCADAPRFVERFGAQRIIHRADLSAQPDAEMVIDGEEPSTLHPHFTIIPTPGHTRGHCVLLHDDYLFTGDHLDFDRRTHSLAAWKSVCWYSWPKQLESIAKLRHYDFSWILPGHGQRVRQSPAENRRQLDLIVRRAA
jgi:glyoxylase-like metal-dependent hydrolase (beta-lactamase superfamily II)/ferredoxin